MERASWDLAGLNLGRDLPAASAPRAPTAHASTSSMISAVTVTSGSGLSHGEGGSGSGRHVWPSLFEQQDGPNLGSGDARTHGSGHDLRAGFPRAGMPWLDTSVGRRTSFGSASGLSTLTSTRSDRSARGLGASPMPGFEWGRRTDGDGSTTSTSGGSRNVMQSPAASSLYSHAEEPNALLMGAQFGSTRSALSAGLPSLSSFGSSAPLSPCGAGRPPRHGSSSSMVPPGAAAAPGMSGPAAGPATSGSSQHAGLGARTTSAGSAGSHFEFQPAQPHAGPPAAHHTAWGATTENGKGVNVAASAPGTSHPPPPAHAPPAHGDDAAIGPRARLGSTASSQGSGSAAGPHGDLGRHAGFAGVSRGPVHDSAQSPPFAASAAASAGAAWPVASQPPPASWTAGGGPAYAVASSSLGDNRWPASGVHAPHVHAQQRVSMAPFVAVPAGAPHHRPGGVHPGAAMGERFQAYDARAGGGPPQHAVPYYYSAGHPPAMAVPAGYAYAHDAGHGGRVHIAGAPPGPPRHPRDAAWASGAPHAPSMHVERGDSPAYATGHREGGPPHAHHHAQQPARDGHAVAGHDGLQPHPSGVFHGARAGPAAAQQPSHVAYASAPPQAPIAQPHGYAQPQHAPPHAQAPTGYARVVPPDTGSTPPHAHVVYTAPGQSKAEQPKTNLIINYLGEMTSAQLRDLCAKFATVLRCRVVIDNRTGRTRGFAFVRTATAEGAARVMESLNGYQHQLGGVPKRLKVAYATPRSKRRRGNAFVSNLQPWVTSEHLRWVAQPYGTVLDCKVLRDARGRSKGVGFVRFSFKREATAAIAALHNQRVLVRDETGEREVSKRFSINMADNAVGSRSQRGGRSGGGGRSNRGPGQGGRNNGKGGRRGGGRGSDQGGDGDWSSDDDAGHRGPSPHSDSGRRSGGRDGRGRKAGSGRRSGDA